MTVRTCETSRELRRCKKLYRHNLALLGVSAQQRVPPAGAPLRQPRFYSQNYPASSGKYLQFAAWSSPPDRELDSDAGPKPDDRPTDFALARLGTEPPGTEIAPAFSGTPAQSPRNPCIRARQQ